MIHRPVVTRHYSTAVGESLTVRLTDGSYVVLNTDTGIAIRTDRGAFHIELEKGEVLCDMAPNPWRHLVVSVGGVRITDTATIFSVLKTNTGAKVTVQEGQVRVSGLHVAEIPLLQNQKLSVDDRSTRPIVKNISPAEVQRELSWQHGELVFVEEKVSVVVQELNRYNKVKIEVLDQKTRNVVIGGHLKATDSLGFVKWIAGEGIGVEWDIRESPDGMVALTLHQAR